MKISEVTVELIKSGYLHIYHDEDDNILDLMKIASIAHIKNYTGLNDEELETKDDLTIALLVLVSELYENRIMTVEKDKVNPVIKSILDSHCINFL